MRDETLDDYLERNNLFLCRELTDEAMEKIFYESHFNEDCDVRDFIEFARAILRKAQEK